MKSKTIENKNHKTSVCVYIYIYIYTHIEASVYTRRQNVHHDLEPRKRQSRGIERTCYFHTHIHTYIHTYIHTFVMLLYVFSSAARKLLVLRCHCFSSLIHLIRMCVPLFIHFLLGSCGGIGIRAQAFSSEIPIFLSWDLRFAGFGACAVGLRVLQPRSLDS